MGPIQTFDELFAFLRRRIDLIASIVGLGIVGGLFMALAITPTYQSQAVISARLNTVSEDIATAGGANSAPARLLQLVEQRLTTRENMLALADKYSLFTESKPQERVDFMRRSVTFLSQAAVAIGFGDDGMVASIIIQSRADEAQKAADVANELAELLIAQTGAGREARARETLEFLRQQQRSLQDEISAMEAEARAYATANAEALPFNVEIRRAELLQIGSAIQAAESEVANLIAAQDAMRIQGSTQRRMIQAREELQARQADLERLRAQRQQLEPFFVRMGEVERELESMAQRQERLRDRLRDLTAQVVLAEGNMRLEASQQIAAYEILERATPADYPISRSRTTSLMIIIVATVIVAAVVAFGWELLRPALRSAGQVERETGMRPVLVLPAMTILPQRRKQTVARLAGMALFVLGVLAAFLPRIVS
jgi:tyrosine-protein kinase Etk/Wzc